MNKSKRLFIIVLHIVGVYVTPTLVFSRPFIITNAPVDSIDDGIITNDISSDDSNTLMR
ncbi:MAG TPA: hypothetical protein VLE21_06695 [Candidatus Nitrosocosmicus sp.]|nr:hypothetical protein [Candidatus Nitrosocosmicus sp.]